MIFLPNGVKTSICFLPAGEGGSDGGAGEEADGAGATAGGAAAAEPTVTTGADDEAFPVFP